MFDTVRFYKLEIMKMAIENNFTKYVKPLSSIYSYTINYTVKTAGLIFVFYILKGWPCAFR